jgi:alginate O-acetyltransferase complex protein AlgI
MQYVSLLYLLAFLPLVLLLYRLLPQRRRWRLLLAASYVFFFLMSKQLIFYLFFSAISIHGIGLWLDACDAAAARAEGEAAEAARLACAQKKKRILCYGVVLHIGLLVLLKYAPFFGQNLNALLLKLPLPVQLPELSLGVPVGISFFSLQAVSYISDVYHRRIRADDNLGRLALFLAFFPVVVEGPICRYSDTAQALYEGKPLEYENVTFGIQRMVWGLFKKLVIADRLNILVEKIFTNYRDYSGIVVLLGAVCYTIQLYADFSGCIDLTIGTAEMFGVTVPENFRQPFFSRTASEFWRRWHITLGTWFKDYLFYPLSLTKHVKKIGREARKKLGRHLGQAAQVFLPLLAVWVCNGFWHGVGWNYLFFGLYYFVLILLGNLWEPAAAGIAKFLHLSREGFLWRAMQTVKMAAIVVTGELFFRANGLRAGFSMFRSIFTGWSAAVLRNGALMKLGLDGYDFAAAAIGLVFVLAVDILHENGISVRRETAELSLPIRWSIYLAVILLVVIFGAYGTGYLPVDPLYAGF